MCLKEYSLDTKSPGSIISVADEYTHKQKKKTSVITHNYWLKLLCQTPMYSFTEKSRVNESDLSNAGLLVK